MLFLVDIVKLLLCWRGFVTIPYEGTRRVVVGVPIGQRLSQEVFDQLVSCSAIGVSEIEEARRQPAIASVCR